MPVLVGYASLFFAAFTAATILPMQSEAVLSGLLLTKNYTTWLLILVASVGNVLGSIVNWTLGRGIERYHAKKWFPITPVALERAKGWYKRYGRWSLLLSWVPFIGDPLTIAAGVLKERLSVFIALVAIAKTARYLVLALIV